MGAKLPLLKPRAVLRALLRTGFYIHHQSGSHAQLRHVTKLHLRVTVPRHDRFDLPRPVLRSILQQAELGVDEFIALL
ncbi:MAG: type II toxin-antitoxin system HicA family toxin [Candidatus Acidiferrales bacterium]